jgi:hypothetical protein
LKKRKSIKATLDSFVELYGKWIDKQKAKNKTGTEKEQEIGQRIIDRLNYNYNRLKANIDCLK